MLHVCVKYTTLPSVVTTLHFSVPSRVTSTEGLDMSRRHFLSEIASTIQGV